MMFEHSPSDSKRFIAFGAVLGAISVGLLAAPSAAQAVEDDGSVEANVAVASAITLTDLTPAFTLSGIPGDTATTGAPVTMTVTTNNAAGYSVTVASTDLVLEGAVPGNATSIPIGLLTVRESGTTDYTGISAVPTTVHTQDGPSIRSPTTTR
jgi:hypothetical protein